MAAALDHLNLTTHLFNWRYTLHKLPHTLLILAVKPLRVVLACVHWTPECICPLEVRGVEVRVANYNCLEPTF